MNAKEVRIGNWVLDESGEKVQIEGVMNASGNEDACILSGGCWLQIHRFKPIPLTEEWLERFGINEYNIINDKIYIHREDDYFQVSEDGFYRCSTEIKYVHQLQNLYHALRGEEIDG